LQPVEKGIHACIIPGMANLLDLSLLSGFAPEPADQADLLQTLVDSLRADLSLLDAGQDGPTLHRLLHTLKGYVCYAHRGPAWQQLSDWTDRTRSGGEAQVQAFAQAWPELRPLLVALTDEIQDWLSSYHSR